VKSIHFGQKVTINGEKMWKHDQKTYSHALHCNTVNEIKSEIKIHINYALTQCLRAFVYYVKARSNVYIFAFATLISFMLGSHLAIPDYSIGFRVIVSSYLMALAAYIYNDIVDCEVDKINKTNRPSVSGKATRRQLFMIVFVLNGTALLLTFSSGLYELLISLAFITLGFVYSHPRSNLKDKFPLKTLVTAAGAALLSLLGGSAAFTTIMTNTYTDANFLFSYCLPVGYAALFFFAFFFILGPLGDICDLKGDRAVGRRTFPIVLGIRSTILFMLSIPLTIILMAGLLAYHSYHSNSTISINLSGVYFIVGTCIATLVFIMRISKKASANDVLAIKYMRPKMRLLFLMLQISLLLTFI
jgi:geranylgeranylglycerol-phosphate geranylgeranyltransferase